MRTRALCLFVLAIVAVLALPGARGSAQPADPPDGFVSVRVRLPAAVRAAGGPPPTLQELGYRNLPIPRGLTAQQFVAILRLNPQIELAEAGTLVFAADTPNDPYYPASQSSYLASIGAPAGWDIATGSNTVIVAVLDSGTDLAHPDFAGRLWENSADRTANGVDDDGNGCVDDRYGCRFVNVTGERASACGYTGSVSGDVQDDHGKPGSSTHSHGTIVAGIAGAAGNNGQGVAGVAWDVRIMTVKVLDCGTPSHLGNPSGDMANVAQGIDYARRMGANVINLSLASSPPNHQLADIAPLRAAIQAAQEAGVIIVAAAGNYGQDSSDPGPGYPAAYTQYPNVIAVGASDNLNGNTWATYSSYGPAIDFAAPGNDIVSTVRSNLGLANPYGSDPRGTSFPAPIVAGTFALLMSRNSGLSAASYIDIARKSATAPVPAPHGGSWAGSGVINVGAALRRVPLTFDGAALHDWKDVPPGTEVRAVIDGQTCGSTTTSAGLLALFDLRVKADGETPGCGAIGKAVEVLVAGLPTTPAVTWGPRNADLDLGTFDVSSVSPPPGPIVGQVIGSGWSNIAHFQAAGEVPAAVSYLPNPWEALYTWDPQGGESGEGAYERYIRGAPAYVNQWSEVQPYQPFWVKAPATTIATPNPNPVSGRAIALSPGWNNFVYTGANRAVGDALGPLQGTYTLVLEYDNAGALWRAHIPAAPRYLNDFGALLKLHIYWIYMKEPATLTMP